jgi:hypothetical protein
MTDEWNPEKDRDPVDRAREMMNDYLEKAKETFSPMLQPASIGMVQPDPWATVQKIKNGFLFVAPSQAPFYCSTIKEIAVELEKYFK